MRHYRAQLYLEITRTRGRGNASSADGPARLSGFRPRRKKKKQVARVYGIRHASLKWRDALALSVGAQSNSRRSSVLTEARRFRTICELSVDVEMLFRGILPRRSVSVCGLSITSRFARMWQMYRHLSLSVKICYISELGGVVYCSAKRIVLIVPTDWCRWDFAPLPRDAHR